MPRLIGRMVARSRPDGRRSALADRRAGRLRLHARADRLPADRGPGLSAGRRAAAGRRLARAHADRCSSRSPRSRASTPGVEQVVTIAGVSRARQQRDARQCRRRLHHAQGLERARQAARICSRSTRVSTARSARSRRPRILVLPPPPIQGIGNAAGFTMQIELRDGSFDFAKLQAIADAHRRPTRSSQSALQRVMTLVPRRRAAIPVEVDRVKARDAAASPSTRCSRRSPTYLGSSYVDQFNKFGRTFQIYVQADAQFRAAAGGHRATSRCATRTAT